MKVWIVEEHIPYEGSTLFGIFSTEEKAKEYLATVHNPYDEISIEDIELDVPIYS